MTERIEEEEETPGVTNEVLLAEQGRAKLYRLKRKQTPLKSLRQKLASNLIAASLTLCRSGVSV